MDDDTAELIRLLCTRAGMIMEDASPVALLAGAKAAGELRATIQEVQELIRRASTMLAAAEALIS